MSGELKQASRLFIAALLICAFIGSVRAQESYPTPAAMDAPSTSAGERDAQADERALAARRQEMIVQCEQNHGSEVDCVRETDTELRAEGMRVGARVIHLRSPAR